MKCPACDVELRMADRQGIEIDYCPQCRGVWLDRGELDKIIERTGVAAAPHPHAALHYAHKHQEYRSHYGKKKHKSFLGELFDFD